MKMWETKSIVLAIVIVLLVYFIFKSFMLQMVIAEGEKVCKTDSDCLTGYACRIPQVSSCSFLCKSDTDCAQGYTCNTKTGKCHT